MQFLYPLFLAALAALAIPVIIHLFYFRRYKKVLFTNVRFLREIKEESSIRSRLKNLLTLLCRLLAVLFLVLGFAQPFIKQDTNVRKGSKVVSIFVDNSYSMAALSQEAPLLEEAKKRAKEIVRAHALEDQIQIISHEMSARQQRLIGRDQALTAIDELDLTLEVSPLSRVLERQKQLLLNDENPNKVIYYIGDFQENIVDFDLTDTLFEYNLVPLQAVVEKNVSIDSAWFEAPVQMLNRPNKLLVKVKNWSEQDLENIQLSLRRDGSVKPVGTLDIPAQSQVVDTVFITVSEPGIQRAELQITDFPIQFDDTYFFAFNVRQQISILIIDQSTPNRYVDAAFASEDYFSKENQKVTILDYGSFNHFQLIVLNELDEITSGLSAALRNYLSQGGNVVVFPSSRADLDSYNQFLDQSEGGRLLRFDTTERVVNYFNPNEFVFRDVFETVRGNLRLPTTQANFIVERGRGRGYEKLLGYRDGKDYLAKFVSGQGHVYLCASPLDLEVNNLVTQAEVFIPMLYKMALSTTRPERPAYTIGLDEFVTMDNRATAAEAVYRVQGPSTFIPSQQVQGKLVLLGFHDQVSDAGFYDVYLKEGEVLNTYAFNSNRLESNPDCLAPGELNDLYLDHASIISQEKQVDLAQFISEKDRGVILWRYCLILALIFLALEALIIRFWSV